MRSEEWISYSNFLKFMSPASPVFNTVESVVLAFSSVCHLGLHHFRQSVSITPNSASPKAYLEANDTYSFVLTKAFSLDCLYWRPFHCDQTKIIT